MVGPVSVVLAAVVSSGLLVVPVTVVAPSLGCNLVRTQSVVVVPREPPPVVPAAFA